MNENEKNIWSQAYWTTRGKFFALCVFSWVLVSIYTLNPYALIGRGWDGFPIWGYIYSTIPLLITLYYIAEPE